jgi:hypothetical protein
MQFPRSSVGLHISLNSHSTGFNLAQNVVGSQVNAEEKVTTISLALICHEGKRLVHAGISACSVHSG